MNGLVILGKKDGWTCCVCLCAIYSSCVIIFSSFIFAFAGHYILIDIDGQCALSSQDKSLLSYTMCVYMYVLFCA